MSLADDLQEIRKPRLCTIGAFISSLTGEDAEALADALAAPPSEVPHKTLARVLKKYIPGGVSDQTVRAHRLDERACACGPR